MNISTGYAFFIILFSLAKVCRCMKVESTEQQLLTSCSGRDSPAWDYRNVDKHIVMWIKGMVTVPGRGRLQARLFNTMHRTYQEHHILGDAEHSLRTIEARGMEGRVSRVTVGQFGGNVRAGPAWQWYGNSLQDGFIYGRMDRLGHFTGDNITYVYPDFRTGLHGTFSNGKIKTAEEVKIVAQRCNNGLIELKLKKNGQYSQTNWTSELVNLTYIGSKPTVRDPLERKSVYVKRTMLTKVKHTDGLYAARSILPGQLVCYYNGVRGPQSFFIKPNMTDKEEEEITATMYSIGSTDKFYPPNFVLLIPNQYRNFIDYKSTVGHKANHNFNNNAYFQIVNHIIYGRIVGLVAHKYIKKDEEIFTNYNYRIEKAPRWYKQLYDEHFGSKKEDKKN